MPTAIIIDDYDDLAKTLASYLEIFGIKTVATGKNGMEAFNLYRAHKSDFIFLDVSMPIYDGFFALEKIKKQDPYAKIIMITADHTKETKQRLNYFGVTEIIYKPFEFAVLKNKLEQIFEIQTTKIP
jgi:CheY-like chemotaxis protein